MHVEHHSLSTDHPEWGPRIHALKISDPHFAHLMDQYEALDKEICRIEEDGHSTVSDTELETLKKQRLQLTDELLSKIRE